MFCLHKYSKWSEVLDTSTSFSKMQVKKCEKCRKVKKRYMLLSHYGNSSIVTADKINKALDE